LSYLHGHDEAVLESHRWRTAENSAGYLLSHLAAGRSLLDVGCGPGTLTLSLARRISPGRVVGLDREESVLAEAAARAEQEGLANVEFRLGDVGHLAYDDGSFEIVHAHQLLQHLSDPVAALEEMARVGRPGGLLAAREADYGGFVWYPFDGRLEAWRQLYCEVARAEGGEPEAGRRLKAWAMAAGLKVSLVSSSVWTFTTDDDRSWWAATWSERMLSTRVGKRALELGLATPEELDDMAEAFAAWARRPEGWFSVLHGEVICEL
jgi:ubiquinone/menaquinone biosynthesis C-methylase UbiE